MDSDYNVSVNMMEGQKTLCLHRQGWGIYTTLEFLVYLFFVLFVKLPPYSIPRQVDIVLTLRDFFKTIILGTIFKKSVFFWKRLI